MEANLGGSFLVNSAVQSQSVTNPVQKIPNLSVSRLYYAILAAAGPT